MGRLAGTVRLAALRNTVAHADAHSALAERYPRPALTRSDCPAIKQGRPLGDRSACSVVSCRPSPVPMAERATGRFGAPDANHCQWLSDVSQADPPAAIRRAGNPSFVSQPHSGGVTKESDST